MNCTEIEECESILSVISEGSGTTITEDLDTCKTLTSDQSFQFPQNSTFYVLSYHPGNCFFVNTSLTLAIYRETEFYNDKDHDSVNVSLPLPWFQV